MPPNSFVPSSRLTLRFFPNCSRFHAQPLRFALSYFQHRVRAPAKAEKKSFSYKVEEDISFKGDEKDMYKLVTLILDNALKYSPTGGYIHLDLKKNKNRIILTTTNTTVNELDEAGLAHFFDRFYRADKSRNSQKNSYGIGLSVARAIVDKHKGKIRAFAKDSKCIVIEASFPK